MSEYDRICHMEPTTGVVASRADEPVYRNT